VVVADEGGRVVFDKEAGELLARGLGPHKAAFHRNHGHFTVGQTVDEAAWWFITMERSCQAQLLAEAAGTPHLIDAEGARYTRDLTGHPLAGWISYQPIHQDIVDSDPDLFD
jgi:ribulose-5-phosphate 4-epimerase/fuculose-1-phosphate aldolase